MGERLLKHNEREASPWCAGCFPPIPPTSPTSAPVRIDWIEANLWYMTRHNEKSGNGRKSALCLKWNWVLLLHPSSLPDCVRHDSDCRAMIMVSLTICNQSTLGLNRRDIRIKTVGPFLLDAGIYIRYPHGFLQSRRPTFPPFRLNTAWYDNWQACWLTSMCSQRTILQTCCWTSLKPWIIERIIDFDMYAYRPTWNDGRNVERFSWLCLNRVLSRLSFEANKKPCRWAYLSTRLWEARPTTFHTRTHRWWDRRPTMYRILLSGSARGRAPSL
jgi:hypothetical protein